MTNYIFFAEASAQPPAFLGMLPFLIIFVIFYFFLIRPQQKKQKQQQAFLASLAKNQQVVTAGGLHGTIISVKDGSAILRVADNVKVEIDKSSISYLKAK